MYFHSETSSYSFFINLWDYFGFLNLISKYMHVLAAL